jgi:Fe2+ or Zn2+ uptake regulation protein
MTHWYRSDVRPQQPARGTRTRGTRQADAMISVLTELTGFRSARDIHAELRCRNERIGLATVYRQLQVLHQDGIVDTPVAKTARPSTADARPPVTTTT